jgi:predicted TPR repeat methyltransferase
MQLQYIVKAMIDECLSQFYNNGTGQSVELGCGHGVSANPRAIQDIQAIGSMNKVKAAHT